jgi:hypothetical protein
VKAGTGFISQTGKGLRPWWAKVSEINDQHKQRRLNRIGCQQAILITVAGLVIICLLAGAVSFFSNQGLPERGEALDRLPPLDKTRLAEALHLKSSLGEDIWPGLGAADIPILLWNQDYAFLTCFEKTCFEKKPDGWEQVLGDNFKGQVYYRQPAVDTTNFAVRVGETWVASMGTKLEADLFVREMIQELLPPPIEQIFPYRVLIQPSEVQISAVLHEAFHVYQAQVAPARFEDAEMAYPDGDRYWAADEGMHEAWKTEIDWLEQALEADSDSQAAALAAQFLDQREARRRENSLSPELVAYEQRLEWLEGLAKYVELESWRLAAETSGFEPLRSMAEDPDFKAYVTFDGRWSQEISQMKRQASREGDTRFYYTGMAQAKVLDRLLPDWKERILLEGYWLEDLLREAIQDVS